MRKLSSGFKFQEYDSVGELSAGDRSLLEAAVHIAGNAYAPYSRYRVGAAIQLDNGIVVTGTNQENMAYPSGLCAERVAIFAAMSQYPGAKVQTIAITARGEFPSDGNPAAPCGGCRQVMLEYELNQKEPIRVLLYSAGGRVWEVNSIQDLVPLHFFEEGLRHDNP